MSFTIGQRMPRLDRWMMRTHTELPGLTWDGAALLESRLAIRHRIGIYTAVMGIAPVACLLVAATVIPDSTSPLHRMSWFVGLQDVAAVLLSGILVSWSMMLHRAEARIGTSLPRRVASDRAVPISRLLGWVRCANVVVSSVFALVIVAAVRESGDGLWLTSTYAVVTAICIASVVWVSWADATRPALAVDEASLRVDQRWRARALLVAIVPVVVLFPFAHFLLPGFGVRGVSSWLGVVTWVSWFFPAGQAMFASLAQISDRALAP